MRILHCVSSLQVGGAEKCVKNLVIAQQRSGLDVAILSFGDKKDAFQKDLEDLGISVINLSGNVISRTFFLLKVISKFTTLHVHSPAVIRAFTLIFPFLLIKNVVYTIHGEVEPPVSFIKQSHWLAMLYLNKAFGVSGKIKSGISQRYAWATSSIEVIENGVPIPSEPVKIGERDSLQLCAVCRLVPLKNLAHLLEAFKYHECYQYASLHIYGDGPEMETLQQLTTSLSLDNVVRFHGAILDEDEIYHDKDALLINSTTEGLPMSLLEAMARGIPAFSSDVGEIPNVITNGKNGVIYSLSDMLTWSTQLQAANTDRKQLKAMGAGARRFMQDHYSIERVSAIYEKSYQ
ncbi:glycosyltransferase family 4 protein [Alteromonas sp. CI.11.F.A3]|uniref:glycosyltransferase family 4 protein n=1 Tax=Alteromonas sp. CI.11.F.A3 TaxID=3079555 RepID=UPI002942CDC9|nr:glycosyltransferase family 4 protein [Alteromonas sp. CI.11.F.A3]WOI38745.1 glycosyltransferase family 4 protein [Alteromonas sp. CI.11.F.A3]